METGSDDDNDTSASKKRKVENAADGSSDVGEGSVIGSELADVAQAGLDELTA